MAGLPTKDDIKAQAVDGRPITQAEAAAIASEESALTGSGPIKGGVAATAQSLHDKQQNFLEKAGEVVRKPPTEVTKEDAAEVQRAEVIYRAGLARAKGGPPGKGSTAADVQSVADTNTQA
uniref:SMP domain-containing protein n=1 Tax=Fusarium oxysporum (strain Fo5176) TaxID=660025 RepID=A0A0D2YGD1_FUSOF